MYAFAQRADTRVVDEPLYAHYLRVSGAQHPGFEQVLASQDPDGERVVREVILGPPGAAVVFFKQMAHHLLDLDLGFLDHTVNVLLTRDPKDMLRSLVHQIPRPTLADTGLARQCTLLEALRARGQDPPVLDARALLEDPADVLAQLCTRLGLRPDPGMLRWPAGPIPEDGTWAPHWYQQVHRSRGFGPYREKHGPMPPELETLYAACRPYYETLFAAAIKPRSCR